MLKKTSELWQPAYVTVDPLVLVAFLAGLGVSLLAALETLPPAPAIEVQNTSYDYSDFYEIIPATDTSETSHASS